MDNQSKEKQEENQLAIPLPKTRFEKYYNFKRKVSSKETNLKYIPITRTASFWVILFFSVFTIITLLSLFFRNYQSLPNEIPIFFSQIDSSWVLLPKAFLMCYLIIPILNIVLLLAPIRRMYNTESRLAVTLMIFMNLSNLFLLIGAFQVISLTIN